jgi:hypothetical protein
MINCLFCLKFLREDDESGSFSYCDHHLNTIHYFNAGNWDMIYWNGLCNNRDYRMVYYCIDELPIEFHLSQYLSGKILFKSKFSPNVTPDNYQQKIPTILTFL